MSKSESIKSASINLALIAELKSFVQDQAGEDALYSTPNEFIRDLIRHEKLEQEAGQPRHGILEGHQDVIQGRIVKFSGNLRKALETLK